MAGYYLIDMRYGRVLRSLVDGTRAKRLVKTGKATMKGHCLYINNEGEYHPSRTRTGRRSDGQPDAWIRGQCYTMSEHGKVHDFRPIDARDWAVFNQATINTGGLKGEFEFGVT